MRKFMVLGHPVCIKCTFYQKFAFVHCDDTLKSGWIAIHVKTETKIQSFFCSWHFNMEYSPDRADIIIHFVSAFS